jgi:hypothetical protein
MPNTTPMAAEIENAPHHFAQRRSGSALLKEPSAARSSARRDAVMSNTIRHSGDRDPEFETAAPRRSISVLAQQVRRPSRQ